MPLFIFLFLSFCGLLPLLDLVLPHLPTISHPGYDRFQRLSHHHPLNVRYHFVRHPQSINMTWEMFADQPVPPHYESHRHFCPSVHRHQLNLQLLILVRLSGFGCWQDVRVGKAIESPGSCLHHQAVLISVYKDKPSLCGSLGLCHPPFLRYVHTI